MIDMPNTGYNMFQGGGYGQSWNPVTKKKKVLPGQEDTGTEDQTTGNTSVTQPPNATTETTPTYQTYESVFGGGPEAATSNFTQQPQQWLDANEIYKNMAGNTQYQDVFNLGNQMAQTGQPVTTQPWYSAMQAKTNTDIMDQIKQAAETAGMTGTRYGSAMGRNSMDIASRAQQNLAGQWAGMEQSAQESAMNRKLGALSPMLSALSQWQGQQGTAAGGLQSLGNQMTQYPLQLAQSAYDMGTGINQTQQQQITDLMNQWTGEQSYSNPALSMGQNFAQTPVSMQYPQYDQSTMGQLLQGITSFLPYLSMGKSGGSTTQNYYGGGS